jgi:hypothetical protein
MRREAQRRARGSKKQTFGAKKQDSYRGTNEIVPRRGERRNAVQQQIA